MMSRYVCAALMAATMSCMPALAETEWLKTARTDPTLSIDYPADWTLDPGEGKTRITLKAPAGSPSGVCSFSWSAMRLTVGSSRADVDAMNVTPNPDSYWTGLVKNFGEIKIVSSGPIQLDGYTAQMAVMELRKDSAPDAVSLKMKMIVHFSPGFSWVLNCSGGAHSAAEAVAAFDTHAAIFEHVFQSFDLGE